MLSVKFIMAIKTSPDKRYEIAHKAKIHPSTLSKIMCGIEKVRKDDLRVIEVGRVLGLKPEECFKSEYPC